MNMSNINDFQDIRWDGLNLGSKYHMKIFQFNLEGSFTNKNFFISSAVKLIFYLP